MRVWIRLLMVWLLAVALPVQGIAGVAMAHCGAAGPARGAALEASRHQHVAPAAETGHHHGARVQAEGPWLVPADTDQPKAQSGPLSDLNPHKCSSCASCCAGSALPSAAPRLAEASAAAPVFAVARVMVDAFASDGPDRPPR